MDAVTRTLQRRWEKMSDLINRQAAIQHLKKRLYETALNNITEHPYYEELADNRVDVWLNELPPAQTEGWMERNKERILQAGMEGREIEFRIGGRLFAIREKAQ